MINNFIYDKVINSPGYSVDLKLNLNELNMFRDAVSKQYIELLKKINPNFYKNKEDDLIQNYHNLKDRIDHAKIIPKINRCLPMDFVDNFKSMQIYKNLVSIFGSFKISGIIADNQTFPNHEEIYWRLVRPNIAEDVGPLHADKWFHEIDHNHNKVLGLNTYTIKIWIPLFSEPGKNGLLVVPDSNSMILNYKTSLRNSSLKPELIDKVESTLVKSEPGNLIIFNENLVHGGAINLGNFTRVSCEITMVFER